MSKIRPEVATPSDSCHDAKSERRPCRCSGAAQAIAARLAGRLRRGIEVSAVPVPGRRR